MCERQTERDRVYPGCVTSGRREVSCEITTAACVRLIEGCKGLGLWLEVRGADPVTGQFPKI